MGDDDGAPWSITTLARAFGMRVSALRYYDELGLLPPRRRRGAVRFYGRAEARRLAFIRHLHHEGLVSLADTATLLAPGTGTWQQVLEASARSIEEQMERLRVAGEIVAHMRRCPDPDPIARCPYLGAQMDAAVDEALARAPAGVSASYPARVLDFPAGKSSIDTTADPV